MVRRSDEDGHYGCLMIIGVFLVILFYIAMNRSTPNDYGDPSFDDPSFDAPTGELWQGRPY